VQDLKALVFSLISLHFKVCSLTVTRKLVLMLSLYYRSSRFEPSVSSGGSRESGVNDRKVQEPISIDAMG